MSITRRRFVFLAILCLILGAATTMGVAVACARWANLQVVGWGNFQRPGESWALDVQSSFGFDAYGLTSRAKAAPSPGFRRMQLPRWASVPSYAPDMPREIVYFAAGWPLRSVRCNSAAVVDPADPRTSHRGHLQGCYLLEHGGRQKPIPLRPITLSFLAGTLFYAAILWLLIPGPFILRRFLRVRRGLCPKCAYQMGESSVCTECGGLLPPQLVSAP